MAELLHQQQHARVVATTATEEKSNVKIEQQQQQQQMQQQDQQTTPTMITSKVIGQDNEANDEEKHGNENIDVNKQEKEENDENEEEDVGNQDDSEDSEDSEDEDDDEEEVVLALNLSGADEKFKKCEKLLMKAVKLKWEQNYQMAYSVCYHVHVVVSVCFGLRQAAVDAWLIFPLAKQFYNRKLSFNNFLVYWKYSHSLIFIKWQTTMRW